MKLLVAVVQENDGERLLARLIEKGYYATKLASIGGFLKHGSSTFLLGVEEDNVDAVSDIIKETCKKREKESYAKKSKRANAEGVVILTVEVEQYIKI